MNYLTPAKLVKAVIAHIKNNISKSRDVIWEEVKVLYVPATSLDESLFNDIYGILAPSLIKNV